MKILSVRSGLIILIAAIITIPEGFAQKTDKIPVTTTTRQIGPDSVNQRSVTAVEYAFPERIYDFKVDTVNKYLTLELRGLSKNGKYLDNRGDVVRFSTAENRVLWSKKVSYQLESIEQYDGVTLHTSGGKTYSLDNESGEQLWQVQNSLLYVGTHLNTAVGYKLKGSKGSEDIVEGISLKDGQALWQRKIGRDYGWNDMMHLNDSTLLIAAAGLHTLNLKDGKGWDYDATTGKKDYTGSAVGTGLGLAAGLLTGMYSVSTGHDLVRNICSNVLADSLDLYFASKQELVRLSKNGETVWKTGLAEDEMSKSLIFKHGTNLIMINWGYANKGQQRINFGRPFMASFDLSTGQSNFSTIISNDKESIRDFKLLEDEVIFVFNKRLEKYSLKDGRLLATKDYDISETGELSYFLGGQAFIKHDNSYSSLAASNPQNLYVYTKNGKALVVDHSLSLTKKISLDDVYIAYLRTKDLSILGKRKDCIIIDKTGKTVFGLPGTTKAVLLNNKLYTANENSLLEIDLTGLSGS